MAFGGLMLALTIICMMLGSVIETSTLFLLAAASFFVGIVMRETGTATGFAFYLAAVLLGFILAPNKLYVLTYAAMGLYILLVECAWKQLGKLTGNVNRKLVFWMIKYIIFNLMFIPLIFFFPQLLFAKKLSGWMMVIIVAAGQIGLFLYDRAYEFVQVRFWNKMRKRM